MPPKKKVTVVRSKGETRRKLQASRETTRFDLHRAKVREQFREERAAATDCKDLIIKTKVPSKWRFVDLETGDVWKFSPHDGMQFSRSSLKDILEHLLPG